MKTSACVHARSREGKPIERGERFYFFKRGTGSFSVAAENPPKY
jgi:hypothetical protein